ncbi:MAG TPA: TIR domain-containing protein [Anaerolineae bacterium]|nr:TIR domain-containing protein [Anaerolineae bacterium]
MAHDVFISYSSHDKAVADAACATLESRKIRCWIAPRDVPAGQTWAGALIEAIDTSRVLVLVLSDGSNRSQQVIREVGEAVDKGIAVLPFRIDDVQPSRDMGYYIRSIHWLDAITPPLEQHLGTLADQVQALLGVQVQPPVPPGPEPPKSRRPAWQWVLAALGALVALLVVSVGIWALARGRAGPATPALAPTDSFAALASATVAEAALATAIRETPPPTLGPATAAATATAALPATPSPLPEAIPALRAIRGPAVPVEGYSVLWSPDGRFLVSRGREIYILDAGAGFKQVRSLDVYAEENGIALSPDGKTLAVRRSGLRLYDFESGGELRTLFEESTSTSSVCGSRIAFSPDGAKLAAVVGDAVQVFDVAGVREPTTIVAKGVNSIAFAHDNQRLFVGGFYGAATLDPATGEQLYAIGDEMSSTPCLVLSPDGLLLATAGHGSAAVALRDAATGRVLRTLAGHEGGLTSLAFSPDGRVLTTAGEDLRIRLWDTATGAELVSVVGHTAVPTSLAFSPGGEVLASADRYGQALLWTFEPAGEVAEPEPTLAAGPFPTLAALSERAISPSNAAQVKLLKTMDQSGIYVAWSRDGRSLALYGFQNNYDITWVSVDSWKAVRTFSFEGGFSDLAVSPDGTLLALHASGAMLFEIETGAELRTLYKNQIGRGSICGSFLSFSPDGKTLAVQEGDVVQLYDVASGTLDNTLVAKGANAIAYAASGRSVYAVTRDGLDALDIVTGEATHLLGDAGSSLRCLASSADGTLLAVSGWNGSIILWDAAAGRQVRTWTGTGEGHSRLALSPDARVLATTGDDLKIRLWDTATGIELTALSGPTGEVGSMAFSPDGAILISAGRDNNVRFWGVEP